MVYEGFVTKLMLLKLRVNLKYYQKDPRIYPIESYLDDKVLGRFIIGQKNLYHILDDMISVWKGLKFLETNISPHLDPAYNDLAELSRLEARVAEMGQVCREAFEIFSNVSSNEDLCDEFLKDLRLEGPRICEVPEGVVKIIATDTIAPDGLEGFQSGVVGGISFSSDSGRGIAGFGEPYQDFGASSLSGSSQDYDVNHDTRRIIYPRQSMTDFFPGPVTPPKVSKKNAGKFLRKIEVKDLDVPSVRIGTDESGKGDYFGPLVVAGVYVNEELERQLLALNVKDSKTNKDAKNIALAQEIKNTLGAKNFYILKLSPRKYNSLYSGSNNLNDLLAWSHATVLENLISRSKCSYAIVDQFAREDLILSNLKKLGKDIEIFQTPKAERDLAVAAASILARETFLSELDKLGQKYGTRFHKGGGNDITSQIQEFCQKHGLDALYGVAKVHFVNTKKAGIVLA
jgi:ribonuclease HIII